MVVDFGGMKKAMLALSLSLLPFLAFADVVNPGYNQYPQATQAGSDASSGAGLILIAVAVYFLFFKKSDK